MQVINPHYFVYKMGFPGFAGYPSAKTKVSVSSSKEYIVTVCISCGPLTYLHNRALGADFSSSPSEMGNERDGVCFVHLAILIFVQYYFQDRFIAA